MQIFIQYASFLHFLLSIDIHRGLVISLPYSESVCILPFIQLRADISKINAVDANLILRPVNTYSGIDILNNNFIAFSNKANFKDNPLMVL